MDGLILVCAIEKPSLQSQLAYLYCQLRCLIGTTAIFPPSNRAEILVDLKLEEGASLTATEAAVKKVEKFLAQQQGIDNYVAYVGTGSTAFLFALRSAIAASQFCPICGVRHRP